MRNVVIYFLLMRNAKARKKKVLERHLECSIDDSVYEEIKNVLEK